MDDTKVEVETISQNAPKGNNSQIAGAIIIAGFIIALAIFLKDAQPPQETIKIPTNPQDFGTLAPISDKEPVLGNANAKLTIVLYEDFQCPFCGRFFSDAEKMIKDDYVAKGKVRLVYRDFAFLGQYVKPYVTAKDESINSAEAARCAGDQGKFWDYHDYLFTHQNGENEGGFNDTNLKSFAQILGLNTTSFNQCLDSNKYEQAVINSNSEAKQAGVTGTPKGFILKGGTIVDTIDGAQPGNIVKAQLDALLK